MTGIDQIIAEEMTTGDPDQIIAKEMITGDPQTKIILLIMEEKGLNTNILQVDHQVGFAFTIYNCLCFSFLIVELLGCVCKVYWDIYSACILQVDLFGMMEGGNGRTPLVEKIGTLILCLEHINILHHLQCW